MSLIVILLVFLIVHYFGAQWLGFKQGLIHRYFTLLQRVLQRSALTQRALATWILLGLLPTLIGGLQYWLVLSNHTLAWFALAVLTLAMAWGSRDLDRDVGRYLGANDAQERCEAAIALTSTCRDTRPEPSDKAVVEGIFYQGLVRWFGVIFWFMVLGAAGAMLFRLAHALLCETQNRSLLGPSQAATAERFAIGLNWLPAAFTTLALAMVGDFDRTLAALKRYYRGRRLFRSLGDEFLPTVGYQTVAHHGSDHDQSVTAAGELATADRALNLIKRILTCWLTVISILILVGWAV